MERKAHRLNTDVIPPRLYILLNRFASEANYTYFISLELKFEKD
jgi:hypothetical protein